MANSVKGVQELGAEIGIVIGGGNLSGVKSSVKLEWTEWQVITWACLQQ